MFEGPTSRWTTKQAVGVNCQEVKRTKSEVMEASTAISIRSLVKVPVDWADRVTECDQMNPHR